MGGYISTQAINKVHFGSIPANNLYLGSTQIWSDSPATIFDVGTGTGDLIIDNNVLGAQIGDSIRIKTGTYQNIRISNFNFPSGRVEIFNENVGPVIIKIEMTLDNIKGLYINGSTSSETYGFQFRDINFRALKLSTHCSNFSLESALFFNVYDYTISVEPSIGKLLYDGTAATRSENIVFKNLKFTNADGIHWEGSVNTDVPLEYDVGHIKNITVEGCIFEDQVSGGTFVWLGNVDGFDVHHNDFRRLNAESENHNSLVLCQGSGDFHHNYANEYQGDMFRAWQFSRVNSTNKKIRIYNNIAANSRKYSAFEFQSFDRYMIPGVIEPGISECFNNTCYNMHYEDNSATPSGNYHGVVLDIFGLIEGSITEAWNNVGINFLYPAGAPGFPRYLFGNTDPQNMYPNSNRYYATLNEAGIIDNIDFKLLSNSPLRTEARTNVYAIDDFYNNTRTEPQTIGAVTF